ncbi:MAG TPA: tyrosine-type recombinase/integrase [Blastocatellia bacterium]|nr:tyrosine-type recombinase/integrase [Blastocatellia bacterium]
MVRFLGSLVPFFRLTNPILRFVSHFGVSAADIFGTSEDEAFVFSSRKTGVKLTDVKHGFNGACTDAGIDDFRFHDLRHTAGTRLADAGADAFIIAEILGHATLQMTKRYTHATDERKRRAVEALTGLGRNVVTRLSQRKSGGRLTAAK